MIWKGMLSSVSKWYQVYYLIFVWEEEGEGMNKVSWVAALITTPQWHLTWCWVTQKYEVAVIVVAALSSSSFLPLPLQAQQRNEPWRQEQQRITIHQLQSGLQLYLGGHQDWLQDLQLWTIRQMLLKTWALSSTTCPNFISLTLLCSTYCSFWWHWHCGNAFLYFTCGTRWCRRRA